MMEVENKMKKLCEVFDTRGILNKFISLLVLFLRLS